MELLIVARVTGCIFISLASWFAGAELERNLKLRWLFLKEMKELIGFLEKEMTYRRNPVEAALEEAAGNCHTRLREMLLAVSEEVRLRQGMDFQSIWKEQLQKSASAGMLDQEQYEAVCEAAGAMCGADSVMQKRNLEMQMVRFEQLSEQASQIYREKSRLYRRLSTAAGAFLIILFL